MSNIVDFRYWDFKEKKMIEGFRGCSVTYVLRMWDVMKHVSPIMQYIGVKDIDKKKIYCGDIVEGEIGSGEKFVGVCQYNSRLGCYVFGNKKTSGNGKAFVTVSRLKKKKVLGNIYGNKDIAEFYGLEMKK